MSVDRYALQQFGGHKSQPIDDGTSKSFVEGSVSSILIY